MPQPAIQVEHLSKAYRIGLKEEVPDTFMGALTGWMKAPLRNWRRLRRLNTFGEAAVSSQPSAGNGQEEEVGGRRSEVGSQNGNTNGRSVDQPSTLNHQPPPDIVWALRDVSFDVHEGEVVGIIGRNGAGKSTLLKILSRITEPTHGRAVIRGRVSSLLEVGTGFHSELTGRENVYMNGTILGMTKREIDRKFDEIVDFSGVERFLDTPIKRYSSGMKVRLAFAVAAHLEPEILIIDEVLAVGDAGFQQKCIGKMHDVAESGRSVLFVSHNAGALRSLCQRGLLLQDGRRSLDGPLPDVLNSYLSELDSLSVNTDLATRADRGGCGEVRIQSIEIQEAGRPVAHGITVGQPMRLLFKLSKRTYAPECKFKVFDANGHLVINCDTRLHSTEDDLSRKQTDLLTCEFDEWLLMPGRYRIDVELFANGTRQDLIPAAIALEVISGRVRGRPLKERNSRPIVAHPHRWLY